MPRAMVIDWGDGCRDVLPPFSLPSPPWRLRHVGILVTDARDCWKCHAPVRDTGVCVVVTDTAGLTSWWVGAYSPFEAMFSESFTQTLAAKFGVRRMYSKSMGSEYMANTCMKCGALFGDNFIFNDFNGRGGGFSNTQYMANPCILYELIAPWDSQPRQYDFWEPGFYQRVDPSRITRVVPPNVGHQFWRSPTS
ncbi:MAG: hypothetical protein LBK59_11100 [Bifidobacteriaceae bacterium]|jgi:hypothetical protein|nr:hypothetical protein [Bifidobacteriaceae bacterium]